MKIGYTPLIEITNILLKNYNINNNKIYLKLENLNPSGSIKDRIIEHIFNDAEKNNLINKDTTILCSSSGNTGISVAMVSALKNYKSIIYTDNKCSIEKKNIIISYGSKLEVIEKDYDFYERIKEKELTNSFCIDQYNNTLNTKAYVETLGPELDNQLTNIDYLVCTGSTGGTFTGLGTYFKQIKNYNTKLVFGDPYGSIIYNEIKKTNLKDPYNSIIEGAGKKRITSIMNLDYIDYIYKISDKKAIEMCKFMANHGYLLGGSSGLNIYTALELINELKIENKNIVIICPDAGYRYISKIYN
jgi:cysteine synthase